MKNKVLILILSLFLTGCASIRYPNWERVSIEKSVYKQPCELRKEVPIADQIKPDDWYKKTATRYEANKVVKMIDVDGAIKAQYFYCAPGIAPYVSQSPIAWTIRNRSNPASTSLDLEKAGIECQYEAHKATIDTSHDNPTRVYIPTDNLFYSLNQLSASRMDRINEELRQLRLNGDRSSLYYECLEVKGFVYIRTKDSAEVEAVSKNCPDIDNSLQPCFIPGS
jgi:hypothetical protein